LTRDAVHVRAIFLALCILAANSSAELGTDIGSPIIHLVIPDRSHTG
jgi:thermostable 8-oxoguanine DNA glycosylase